MILLRTLLHYYTFLNILFFILTSNFLIYSDLFPGIDRPDIDYGALLQALKLSCEKCGLQPVPFFLGKNIQLYETLVVRHGLMVVGPTGAGKSTFKIKTLRM